VAQRFHWHLLPLLNGVLNLGFEKERVAQFLPLSDSSLDIAPPTGWGYTTLSLEAALPMALQEIMSLTRLRSPNLSSTAHWQTSQAAAAFKLRVGASIGVQFYTFLAMTWMCGESLWATILRAIPNHVCWYVSFAWSLVPGPSQCTT
jgi:hypothetical protein